MPLAKKFCLICDDAAVIEVISVQLQGAPLCGLHWADYCQNEGGLTADEVRKFFDDGAHGDEPKPVEYIVSQSVYGKKTDEEQKPYRTDEREEG